MAKLREKLHDKIDDVHTLQTQSDPGSVVAARLKRQNRTIQFSQKELEAIDTIIHEQRSKNTSKNSSKNSSKNNSKKSSKNNSPNKKAKRPRSSKPPKPKLLTSLTSALPAPNAFAKYSNQQKYKTFLANKEKEFLRHKSKVKSP